MKRTGLLFISILSFAFSAPSSARAEGFVDLRVGGAFTEDNDVKISAGPGSFVLTTAMPPVFSAIAWRKSRLRLPGFGTSVEVPATASTETSEPRNPPGSRL